MPTKQYRPIRILAHLYAMQKASREMSGGILHYAAVHPEVQVQLYGIGTPRRRREEFRACNAYARPECKDCWAKFYCSGGCAANAFHASGSIRGVYEPGCELFRKRIECAIMMKVAEASDPALQKYAKAAPAGFTEDCEDCEGC